MNKSRIKSGRFFNILFFGLTVGLLYQRVPGWIANFSVEGKSVATFEAITENGDRLKLPQQGKKQVMVFWATWCGPCGIELSRLNSAVIDGDLKAEDVIAVSIGEEPSVVWAAAKERDYRFLTVADPDLNSRIAFDVQGTPQTFHVDEESRIQHASTGLGFFTVWRAEWFLSSN